MVAEVPPLAPPLREEVVAEVPPVTPPELLVESVELPPLLPPEEADPELPPPIPDEVFVEELALAPPWLLLVAAFVPPLAGVDVVDSTLDVPPAPAALPVVPPERALLFPEEQAHANEKSNEHDRRDKERLSFIGAIVAPLSPPPETWATFWLCSVCRPGAWPGARRRR
jgi:hypothetical protein